MATGSPSTAPYLCKKGLLMTIGILAAVLGVLIAAGSIGIPHLIRRRLQRNDDGDAASRAYLKATGRSAQDIARSNADGGSR